MKSIQLLWAMVIIIVAVTTLPASIVTTAENSLSESLSLADQSQKNLFISFKAEWCLPCHMYKQGALSDKQVTDLLDQSFIAREVDIDNEAQKDWNQSYSVSCLPTMLVLNSKGEILEEINKQLPTEELLATLAPYAKKKNTNSNVVAVNKPVPSTVVPSATITTNSKGKSESITTARMPASKKTSNTNNYSPVKKYPVKQETKIMMNNSIITKPQSQKTITVGAFANYDNLLNYKDKLEKALGHSFFVTVKPDNLYQLNIGQFQDKAQVANIIAWLKKNNKDFYIRKIN